MTLWLIFGAIVAAMFVTDLFLKRGAVIRVLTCIAISIGFGVFIWLQRGQDDALKYFTAYTLEMSLSLDNVFVISLIFGALAIPQYLRERVLLIGIISALVLRGLFIGAGVALVGAFDWLLILAGIFLIWTGSKMVFTDEPEEVDLEKNRVLKLLRRFVPVTTQIHGGKFFVKPWVEVPGTRVVVSENPDAPDGPERIERAEERQLGIHATPLFVALVLVEIADVVFAADSVPASLAVTTDAFLVYTSNIFAIMGLRALYSVLEKMVNAFEHLDKAIAAVLIFIGVKVVAAHTIHFHVGNLVSLGVVLSLLAVGIIASLWSRKSAPQT